MKWIFILLFAGLVVFRFTYLDQDVPAYQLTNITQEDEPYYCQGAMNKFCASEGRVLKGFKNTKGEGLDEYNRLITFASLKVFGNNYWGLRIPVVLASLMFLWFMYLAFKELNVSNNIIVLLLFLIATNFYLLAYSRYFNPEIFSVLDIGITLWLIVKYGFSRPWPVIAIGFVAGFTVIFVYVMNFFLLAGVGLFLVIDAIRIKSIKAVVLYSLGIVSCFLFFAICLMATGVSLKGHFSMILNFGMGGSGVMSDLNGIHAIVLNIKSAIIAIVNTGYLRYQLSLLFFAGLAIPVLIVQARNAGNKNHNLALLLLLIMACQFMQNCFAMNYPYKKMIVDLPVVFIATGLMMSEDPLSYWRKNLTRKISFIAWLVVVFFICFFNFRTNKSPMYWGYNNAGCYENTPLWFNAVNMGICVLLVLLAGGLLLYENLKLYKTIFTIAMIGTVLAGFLMSYKVFLSERKYEITNCLKELAPMLHGKVVSGGFPYEYSLYTNSTPVLHEYSLDYLSRERYLVLDSLLENNTVDYVISKANSSTTDERTLYTYNKYLQLVKKYKFSCYDYYLYKNINK